MLEIKTPVKEGDVVSFKLITGEEIVGEFVREEDNTIVLNKPVVLHLHPQGMAFEPYMMTTKPETEIPFNMNVLCVTMVKTREELAKAYKEQTTDIALP